MTTALDLSPHQRRALHDLVVSHHITAGTLVAPCNCVQCQALRTVLGTVGTEADLLAADRAFNSAKNDGSLQRDADMRALNRELNQGGAK